MVEGAASKVKPTAAEPPGYTYAEAAVRDRGYGDRQGFRGVKEDYTR